MRQFDKPRHPNYALALLFEAFRPTFRHNFPRAHHYTRLQMPTLQESK